MSMQDVSLIDPEVPEPDTMSDNEEKMPEIIINKVERPHNTKSGRRISITAVEERKARLSKHSVYIIACEPPLPGVVTVARRYNEYKWLRMTLHNQFPGLFVPPLPPSKTFGRFANDFVEERRVDLERFLNRVESVPCFSDSLCFQLFLSRPESTFASGKNEVIEKCNQSESEITYKLQNEFPNIHESELSDTHADEDIPRLREFLLKIEQQMRQFNLIAQKLLNNLNAAANEMNSLHESLVGLYQAETHYPYKPSIERFDIQKPFEEWVLFQTRQTDVYYVNLLRQLRYEHEDIIGFLEVLDQREGIQHRCNVRKNKNEKWRVKETEGAELTEPEQVQKDTDMTEERELFEYLHIVTKIILQSEITEVWDRKIHDFREQMLEFTHEQTALTRQMLTVWQNSIST